MGCHHNLERERERERDQWKKSFILHNTGAVIVIYLRHSLATAAMVTDQHCQLQCTRNSIARHCLISKGWGALRFPTSYPIPTALQCNNSNRPPTLIINSALSIPLLTSFTYLFRTKTVCMVVITWAYNYPQYSV